MGCGSVYLLRVVGVVGQRLVLQDLVDLPHAQRFVQRAVALLQPGVQRPPDKVQRSRSGAVQRLRPLAPRRRLRPRRQHPARAALVQVGALLPRAKVGEATAGRGRCGDGEVPSTRDVLLVPC